jgi:hypothetical protein
VKAAETNMSCTSLQNYLPFCAWIWWTVALFLGYTSKPTSHHLWLSSDNSVCLSSLSSRYGSMLTDTSTPPQEAGNFSGWHYIVDSDIFKIALNLPKLIPSLLATS